MGQAPEKTDVEKAFRAVWYNRPQELETLLKEKRVDIDVIYTNGATLMHDAIHCLRVDALAVLLMFGGEATPKTFELFFHGDSKKRRIMEALLWGKADMQALVCFDCVSVPLLDHNNNNKSNHSNDNNNKNDDLTIASEYCHAHVNDEDEDDYDLLQKLNATTVLMDAASGGYAYAVRWLVSHRRALVDFQNPYSGLTALLCAIESQMDDAADALVLHAGAKISFPASQKLHTYHEQYSLRFPRSTDERRYAAMLRVQIGLTTLHNRIERIKFSPK